MTIGQKIAEARQRTGHSQKSLAAMEEIPVSKESIAKYETGARNFPKDMYPRISGALDDPQFYFETWQETTGYVSMPFLDGPAIERRAAAMAHLVKKETVEAIERVEKTCWFSPPDQRPEEEMNELIGELLDAAASMTNLVAALCKENELSMKRAFQKWRVSLKARKYEK
ncbi:helix-turn-helix domain-containing protein [Bacillus badius]|uniref:Transcriptional regulator n=1 Tax=Bacillus badius TaxID=1455 RepID=A0ABR5B1Q7_BACBA|nr:helix-turn-helix transcriptional regulator [Bacillus badius]KIL73694.1 hypothetical protein SD78_3882 [Bacillus badius]KIL80700.1 hypothetical protein SD77_0548 [Bacillus badius]MED4715371.1 helix-turn-helix transcriptional regulator [Bacillus badius]UAT31929.1 helix-turn-helix domain-containing protein [Bacillus badius]GLY10366.1 hypothetical protein Bbad01_15820 [Bacillus badius]